MKQTTYRFPGRLALQQRVLPTYRIKFFDELASVCNGGLSVLAGQPLPREQIVTSDHLNVASFYPTHNHHFLSVDSPFFRCRQESLVQWLENWQPDALIVEANPRYTSTPDAIRWMHAHGHPVLGWGLGAQKHRGMMSKYRQWKRQIFLKSLDGIISYSHKGAKEYLNIGFSPEKVFVARNAVLSRPENPPPDRPTFFAERATVLFVGRLQERKKIDNLLKACAHLPENLQPRLWIIGEGPNRDEFQSLAYRIYPRAEFIGALYGKELDEYFKSADIFVLPGTGGLAVQQAMAFGLPVIVAEGDGTQEDLVNSKNGWIIEPDDSQALASALYSALSDPLMLRKMGRESFRISVQEVNIEAMVDVFLKALASVVR